jgi:hypothetical protein
MDHDEYEKQRKNNVHKVLEAKVATAEMFRQLAANADASPDTEKVWKERAEEDGETVRTYSRARKKSED